MQSLVDQIKRVPEIIAAVAVVVGFAVGLIYGWGLNPPDFTDATPAHLRADLQEDYLRMAIDSYLVNQNNDLAVQRWQGLGEAAPGAFRRIQQNPAQADPELIAAYGQLIESVLGTAAAAPNASSSPSSGAPSVMRPLVVVGGVLALAVVVVAVLALAGRLPRRRPAEDEMLFSEPDFVVEPSGGGQASSPASPEPAPRPTAKPVAGAAAGKTNFEKLGLAPPITQTITTYMLGDDLYDESFSIDTGGGEFLGEYGVGISEAIGVGDPKKVTALEIWLFDKNDINTATKVLMSAHAYNDTGIRDRLERKGDLILVEPQQQVLLETKTLQLLATIVDLEYGRGALPQNSYFERLTLELAVWPK
jgi:hypothetical protein